MRGYSVARIRTDRHLLGPLLEGFVFSELLKQLSWDDERISLFHYRDRDKFEVDFAANPVGVARIHIRGTAR
jgi:predicted AAA+ superfamily ATPase